MVNFSATPPGEGGKSDEQLLSVSKAQLLSLIQQHEAEYRSLFVAAPVGIFVCDQNAVIQQYNPQAAKLWGSKPVCGVDRFCGSKKMWLPNGTRLQNLQSPIVEVLRMGIRIDDVELSLERHSDLPLPVLMNFAPLSNMEGAITGAIVSFIDLSERKRLEAAVRDSETRYRSLFDTAHDAILVFDANHQMIVHSNLSMTQLLGYRREDLVGKYLWQLCLPDDRTECQLAVRELLEIGGSRFEHVRLRSAGGDEVEVEIVANVFEQGGRRLVQCNIRDISDRCRRERLVNEQAEVLIDSNRAKDEFLAMLSHELRNPLDPISNAVHLLSLETDDAKIQGEARSIIQRQVEKLKRLVDDLTEVLRPTSERVHLHTSRVAISEVVQSAIDSTRSLLGERQQRIEVVLSKESIWLKADKARLEQVFVNLLMNAAKYTDIGGHISVEVQLAGSECVVRIRDDGIGIAPEKLPGIFEVFTQVDRTENRTQGEVSISLELVKRLVMLHGGRVEARSDIGKGSEFVIHLPVIVNSVIPQVIEPEAQCDNDAGLRVLVGNEDEDAARSLGMFLRAKGHAVRTAFDGATAIEAALSDRPDAIFLDIALPGHSGYEVVKRLRQRVGFNNVTFIALTSYGNASDRLFSEQAGFDHHLVKPVDFTKIEQILLTILG